MALSCPQIMLKMKMITDSIDLFTTFYIHPRSLNMNIEWFFPNKPSSHCNKLVQSFHQLMSKIEQVSNWTISCTIYLFMEGGLVIFQVLCQALSQQFDEKNKIMQLDCFLISIFISILVKLQASGLHCYVSNHAGVKRYS